MDLKKLAVASLPEAFPEVTTKSGKKLGRQVTVTVKEDKGGLSVSCRVNFPKSAVRSVALNVEASSNAIRFAPVTPNGGDMAMALALFMHRVASESEQVAPVTCEKNSKGISFGFGSLNAPKSETKPTQSAAASSSKGGAQ